MVSENDPEVQQYLEDLTQESYSTPEKMRKAVLWNTQTALGKRVFGWADNPSYQPVAWSGQIQKNESGGLSRPVPMAGSTEKMGDLGAGGFVNPSADESGSLRARLQKQR